MKIKYKRTIKQDLSFPGEKLTRGRHKMHPYPAMLHPLLVNFLIDNYATKNSIIFDPFCGSGVTLFQASVKGYKSLGFDINPLALLIAKTKTSKYNIKELKKEVERFKKEVEKNKKSSVPQIKNMDYWYTKETINDLGRIRHILKNKKYKYKDFLLTNFAFVCRNQSLTRNGEFKRYRIKPEKIKNIKNKVFETLFSHINSTIEIFSSTTKPKRNSRPILANSENRIDSKIKYDLVITSPPYGDSKTTVAYGEYSSFGSEWLSELNSSGFVKYKIDKEGLGKVNPINKELKNHKILMDTIKKIEKKDAKRASQVINFFNGYYNAIRNTTTNLLKNGKACFVVGNRTVKGHQIPMDQITASFLEDFGLSYENIFVRDILNKVMPSKNSPSNRSGIKSKTMSNEYIVIFNKK